MRKVVIGQSRLNNLSNGCSSTNSLKEGKENSNNNIKDKRNWNNNHRKDKWRRELNSKNMNIS